MLVSSKVRHFLLRGEAFFASMNQLADEVLFDEADLVTHRPTVALLSVHASIAFSDAAHTYLTGDPVKADDHSVAVKCLRRECGNAGRTASGVEHLAWLIKHKHHFSYGSKTVRLDEVAKAKVKAERFAAWTFRTFPELGARDD